MNAALELQNGTYVLVFGDTPGYHTPPSKSLVVNNDTHVIQVEYRVLTPQHKVRFTTNVAFATVNITDSQGRSTIVVIHDGHEINLYDDTYTFVYGDVAGMDKPADLALTLIKDEVVNAQYVMIPIP
jgi:hypothetical protein